MPKPRLDLAGVSILVVEDADDSRDMMGQMVASFGARPLLAANGLDARELVNATAPDLVFCDLLMPVSDGFQFMEWLRSQHRLCRVPVIAVTALGSPVDVMRTWAAGFNGHLVKPIEYAQVEAQLRRAFWAHVDE
jgi:CheY-like chemotaxis protein